MDRKKRLSFDLNEFVQKEVDSTEKRDLINKRDEEGSKPSDFGQFARDLEQTIIERNKAITEAERKGADQPFSISLSDVGLTRQEASDFEDLLGQNRFNPFSENLREDAAKAQSGWSLAGKAASNILAEVTLGTLEATGYMLDVTNWYQAFGGGEGEKNFDNDFAKFFREAKESWQDSTRVYTTQRADEGLAFGDGTWWASNAPSIFSTVTMLLPSMAAVKALNIVGNSLRAAGIANKAARGINRFATKGWSKMRGTDLRHAHLERLNMQDALTHQVISRNIYNTQEAMSTYTETLEALKQEHHQDLIDGNITMAELEKKAGDAAAHTWRVNTFNVVLGLPQSMMLYRAPINSINRLRNNSFAVKPALQWAKKNKKANKGRSTDEIIRKYKESPEHQKVVNSLKASKLKVGAVGTVGQGAEEISLYLARENAKREALGEGNFWDLVRNNLGEDFTSAHLWDAGFWGAAGGIMYQTIGYGIKKAVDGVGNRLDKTRKPGVKVLPAEEIALKFAQSRDALLNNEEGLAAKQLHSLNASMMEHAQEGIFYQLQDDLAAFRDFALEQGNQEDADNYSKMLEHTEQYAKKAEKYSNDLNMSEGQAYIMAGMDQALSINKEAIGMFNEAREKFINENDLNRDVVEYLEAEAALIGLENLSTDNLNVLAHLMSKKGVNEYRKKLEAKKDGITDNKEFRKEIAKIKAAEGYAKFIENSTVRIRAEISTESLNEFISDYTDNGFTGNVKKEFDTFNTIKNEQLIKQGVEEYKGMTAENREALRTSTKANKDLDPEVKEAILKEFDRIDKEGEKADKESAKQDVSGKEKRKADNYKKQKADAKKAEKEELDRINKLLEEGSEEVDPTDNKEANKEADINRLEEAIASMFNEHKEGMPTNQAEKKALLEVAKDLNNKNNFRAIAEELIESGKDIEFIDNLAANLESLRNPKPTSSPKGKAAFVNENPVTPESSASSNEFTSIAVEGSTEITQAISSPSVMFTSEEGRVGETFVDYHREGIEYMTSKEFIDDLENGNVEFLYQIKHAKARSEDATGSENVNAKLGREDYDRLSYDIIARRKGHPDVVISSSYYNATEGKGIYTTRYQEAVKKINKSNLNNEAKQKALKELEINKTLEDKFRKELLEEYHNDASPNTEAFVSSKFKPNLTIDNFFSGKITDNTNKGENLEGLSKLSDSLKDRPLYYGIVVGKGDARQFDVPNESEVKSKLGVTELIKPDINQAPDGAVFVYVKAPNGKGIPVQLVTKALANYENVPNIEKLLSDLASKDFRKRGDADELLPDITPYKVTYDTDTETYSLELKHKEKTPIPNLSLNEAAAKILETVPQIDVNRINREGEVEGYNSYNERVADKWLFSTFVPNKPLTAPTVQHRVAGTEAAPQADTSIEARKADVEPEFEKGDYAKVLQLVKDTVEGKDTNTPENLQFLTNYPKLFEKYMDIERKRQEALNAADNPKIKGIERLSNLIGKPFDELSGSDVNESNAVKVLNEIYRLRKNGGLTESESRRLQRLEDNAKVLGFEITDYIGQKFDERMNIDTINFVEGTSPESTNKVITRIIKPGILKKGVIEQRAQVEVMQSATQEEINNAINKFKEDSINKRKNKINAKYDAELADLETQESKSGEETKGDTNLNEQVDIKADFFLSTPNSDGSFNESSASKTYKEGASIYKFERSGNKAKFIIDSSKESSVKLALQYADKSILPVSNENNAYDANVDVITTVQAGEAELQNGRWVVTKKAEIFYGEPDNLTTSDSLDSTETVSPEDSIVARPVPQPEQKASTDESIKEGEEAKGEESDIDIGDDTNFNLVDSETPYVKWDREREMAELDRMLPEGLPVSIKEGLLEINSKGGLSAYGMFKQGVIIISSLAQEGTAYHEAFHAVFNLFLNEEQKNKLIAEAKKRFTPPSKTSIDNLKELYPDASDAQIENLYYEEQMADEFQRYKLRQDGAQKKSFGRRLGNTIHNFFKNLWNTIKLMFNRGSALEKLYHNIDRGAFKNSEVLESVKNKLGTQTNYSTINSVTQASIRVKAAEKLNNIFIHQTLPQIKKARIAQAKKNGDTELEQKYTYAELEDLLSPEFEGILGAYKHLRNTLIKGRDKYRKAGQDEMADTLNNYALMMKTNDGKQGVLMNYLIKDLSRFGITINPYKLFDIQSLTETMSEETRTMLESTEENETVQEHWQKANNMISSWDKVSKPFKRYIGSIVKTVADAQGNVEVSKKEGFTEFVNRSYVFNTLQRELSDSTGISHIKSKLEALAESQDFAKIIYDDIFNKGEFRKNHGIMESNEDMSLIETELFNLGNNTHNEYTIVGVDNSGESMVFAANKVGVAADVIADFKYHAETRKNLKASTEKALETFGTKEFKNSMQKGFVDNDSSEGGPSRVLSNKVLQALENTLKNTAFPLTVKEMDVIQKASAKGPVNLKNLIYLGSNSIRAVMEAQLKADNLYTIFEDGSQSGALKYIGKSVGKARTSYYSISHVDANGNRVQGNVTGSYLSSEFAKLKNEEGYLEKIMNNDDLLAHSPLLKELKASPSLLEAFSKTVFEAYKSPDTKVAKSYDSMSPIEFMEAQLNGYVNKGNNQGYFFMPILADAPNGVMIRHKKSSNIGEAVRRLGEAVLQEQKANIALMNKYQEASEEVKQQMEDKFGKMLDKSIGENRKSPQFVMFKDLMGNRTDLTKVEIEEIVKDKLYDLTESFVKELQTDGIIDADKNPVPNKLDVKNAAKLEELIFRFIADKKYMDSQLIWLFNGDVTHYKHSTDFYKRIKQVYSPRIPLNTRNMKGAFVDAKGNKFSSSLILTDIERPAKRLKPIKDALLSNTQLSKKAVYSTMALYGLGTKVGDEFVGIEKNDAKYVLSNGKSLFFAEDQTDTYTTTNKEGEKVFKNDVSTSNLKEGKSIKNVEVTDAQTWISLDRYLDIMEGRSMANQKLRDAVVRLKKGKGTTNDVMKVLLNPLKPFTYDTIYDETLGRRVPYQNKTSEMVLIPQLVQMAEDMKTEHAPLMKKIMKLFNEGFDDKNGPERLESISFRTAVKLGNEKEMTLDDLGTAEESSILETLNLVPLESYGIQVETPAHYKDFSNNLATQVRKIINSDIPPTESIELVSPITIDGEVKQNVTVEELIKIYDDAFSKDIIEDYNKLLERFDSPKEMIDLIRENAIERNKDNLVEALEQIGDNPSNTLLPLWSPLLIKDTQAILNSVLRNNITKRKIKGGGFINASGILFSDQLDIVFKEDGTLDHYEVMMPAQFKWMEQYADENGIIDPTEIAKEAGNQALEGIMYRVPTESLYSMFKFKVKKYTSGEDGAYVMMPDEVTKISGLDFDVDKVYAMFYSFKEVINFDSLIKDDKSLSEVKNILVQDPNTEAFDSVDKIRDLLTIKNEDLNEGQIALKNKIISTLKPQHLTVEYIEPSMDSKEGRDNLKIVLFSSILSSKQAIERTFKTGNYNTVKSDIDYILGLQGKSLETNVPFTGPDTAKEIFERNMTGAKLIGVMANHRTHHALVQHEGLDIQVMDGNDAYTFKFNNQPLNIYSPMYKPGSQELISSIIEEYLAAVVDNAKDPLASFGNIGLDTAGTLMTLIRMGVSNRDALMFINQPVIKRFTKELKASTNTSIYKLFTQYKKKDFKSVKPEAQNAVDFSVMNTDVLTAGIETPSKLSAAQKYHILKNYVMLNNTASKLGKLNKISSKTTNGVSPSIGAALEITQLIENILESNTFPITNVEKILELGHGFKYSSELQLLDKGIGGIERFAKKLELPYVTPFFKSIPKKLSQIQGLDTVSEQERNRLNEFGMTFFSSGFNKFKLTPEKRESLLKDLPEWLAKEKSDVKSDRFQGFLDFFEVSKLPSGEHTISFKMPPDADNAVRSKAQAGWLEMFTDSVYNRHANDLLLFGFMKNGFNFGNDNFLHMLPPVVEANLSQDNVRFIDYMKDTFNELNEGADMQFMQEIMIDQYVRNRYVTSELVPNKGLPISDSEKISTFVIDFKNDNAFKKGDGTPIEYVNFKTRLKDNKSFAKGTETNILGKLSYTNEAGKAFYKPVKRLGIHNNFIEVDQHTQDLQSIFKTRYPLAIQFAKDAAPQSDVKEGYTERPTAKDESVETTATATEQVTKLWNDNSKTINKARPDLTLEILQEVANEEGLETVEKIIKNCY